MVKDILSFNSHNSGYFRLIKIKKISKSKLGSCLSKTKGISEIEQNAFVLLLIKRKTLFGTPGICVQGITVKAPEIESDL